MLTLTAISVMFLLKRPFPELLIRRFDQESTYSFPMGSVNTAPMVGKLGTGVEYNETFTIWEQGSLKETSNPFDLALGKREVFLAVETNDGERYTRNGSFVLGKEGYLLTKNGEFVLGENGPIQIKKNNFTIDKQGRIWQNSDLADDPNRLVSMEENDWANTELVDTLKVVNFNRPRHLLKQGNSFWASTEISGQAEIARGSDRPGVPAGFY
jgi:flagellar basal-body rod protein FlgF